MDAKTCPTMWTGISFEVEEIKLGARVVTAKMRDFESAAATIDGATQAHHLINLKLAAERMAESAKTISIITGQVNSLSAHLAGILAHHASRGGNGRE